MLSYCEKYFHSYEKYFPNHEDYFHNYEDYFPLLRELLPYYEDYFLLILREILPMSKLIISKSNNLIETSYKLGKREQYFILYLISKIDSINDKDFINYEMSPEDIKRIINYDGVKRIGNSTELFDILNNLNKVPIKWETDEAIGQVFWLSSMTYNKIKGTFSFTFTEALRDFLLELSGHFTQYDLKNIRNLKKGHSIRMYEIIKRKQERKPYCKFKIEVDKLKFFLGVSNKYPNFYDFKKNVLESSIKEISRHTDINVSYEISRKVKKKVEELQFSIVAKKETKALPAKTAKKGAQDATGYEGKLKKAKGMLYSRPNLEIQIRNKYGNLSDQALVAVLGKMFPEKFK